MSRASLLALAMLVASSVATPAWADDAQAGRTLFNEGVALFSAGNYDAACPKLEASLKAYPGLGTRGKLAECYEKQGRLASAWQTYRDVAQLAVRGGDPTREQVASARAKALEGKLSYLTIVVPPTSEIAGLVIKRNGTDLERAKLGSAEPVDAGNIAIELSAPGRKAVTLQLVISQGQTSRFEVPALEPASPSTVGSGTTPSPPPTEPPVVYSDPPAWQKPLGLVLVGVGAVGLGVGGALGLSAKSKYDGAFDGGGCDKATKTCDAAGQSAVDSASSTATVSTILFVSGGVLAVAGGIFFLTAPSARPQAVRVLPMTYAGGAGVAVAGVL